MRHPMNFAVFVAFALLSVLPASAQHGGMRSSGGGSHGGAVAHSSGGFASGGHAFSGVRSGPVSRSGYAVRGSGVASRYGAGGVRFGSRGNCIGCRRGNGYSRYPRYGYGYAGLYYPFGWWDSSSSYDGDDARELALASDMDEVSVEQQRLREQEERDGDRDSYAERRSQVREQTASQATSSAEPATALVFRDQHVEEVRNYAIAGANLWVFTDQASRRIPLAQLDIAATTRMNDDRGVDFQVPGPVLSLRIAN